LSHLSNPRTVLAVAAAVLVIAVAGAVLAARSSGSSRAASTTVPRATTSTTSGPAPTLAPGSSVGPTTTAGSASTTSLAPPTPGQLPLVVTVSSTSGLHDGQAVTVHVVPKPGSDIYGIEARVCAPKATITVESDFYPNQTGNCALHALSSRADAHVSVAASPPYQSSDLTFHVGTGSDHFTTEYGQSVSITCGPGHPCQLVLLLQVPGGFGFQSYPLTFA
jgi:hypothetical protein